MTAKPSRRKAGVGHAGETVVVGSAIGLNAAEPRRAGLSRVEARLLAQGRHQRATDHLSTLALDAARRGRAGSVKEAAVVGALRPSGTGAAPAHAEGSAVPKARRDEGIGGAAQGDADIADPYCAGIASARVRARVDARIWTAVGVWSRVTGISNSRVSCVASIHGEPGDCSASTADSHERDESDCDKPHPQPRAKTPGEKRSQDDTPPPSVGQQGVASNPLQDDGGRRGREARGVTNCRSTPAAAWRGDRNTDRRRAP
jgi:hypothetical protein